MQQLHGEISLLPAHVRFCRVHDLERPRNDLLPLHRSRRRKECSRCSLQAAGCLFLSCGFAPTRTGSRKALYQVNPRSSGDTNAALSPTTACRHAEQEALTGFRPLDSLDIRFKAGLYRLGLGSLPCPKHLPSLSLRSGSGEETHLADPATAGSLQSRSREALLWRQGGNATKHKAHRHREV